MANTNGNDPDVVSVPEPDLRRLGLATAYLVAQQAHSEDDMDWAAEMIEQYGGMEAVAKSLGSFWERMTEWEANR